MSKPYRERAELFAQNPQGRIYGGFYPGQGFGTFGGGVDPGEDPQEAAAREFIEESGYPVSNVRQAPVGPYVEDWKPLSKKPEYANDPKFQERFKKFKGSRTHYFVGDIAGKRKSKGSNDSAYPFESVRFRAAPTVISKHEKDLQSVTDPVDVARLQQRLAVLQSMLEKKAMPFKSKAQQRFMFASEAEGELPKGTAKRWANETEKKKGGIEALPEKVSKKTASALADTIVKLAISEEMAQRAILNRMRRESFVPEYAKLDQINLEGRGRIPFEWTGDHFSQAADLQKKYPRSFSRAGGLKPGEVSSHFSNAPKAAVKSKLLRNLGIGGAALGALGIGTGIALPLALSGRKEVEKVAYNPAKDYWDSTWWGRSADRKKRKADAQEELMKELGNLSPEELQARLGKKTSLASPLFKQAFWGSKKIKVWDPEELYEEQRKTDTPEQLLDTDLYNALYMANQGMGTGLLHRKGFKYPKPGKDLMFGDYKDRIAGLKPEQKQFISEILWGAQPTPGKTASTRSIIMKKSAAEIAEEVCTPEEKAKCCKGDEKKEEKKEEPKDEKKDEKSEDKGNPFAKKDEKSEDKGFPFEKKEAASCGSSSKPMPKKKGFKPFPKKNIKKASDIADMILRKNAASSTDFIDKMRSKADKGLDATSRAAGKGIDATSRAAKSVVKKKDKAEGVLRSTASKGVDAVNKGVNKASKKLKSVIEKKSSAKIAADVLKMTTPPLPRPIPQTPEVKQMKAQMAAPMPWEKSAATRWEQVFRESPEILEGAFRKAMPGGSSERALQEMQDFMKSKDVLQQGMYNIEPSRANVDQVKQVLRNFGKAEPRLSRLSLRRGRPTEQSSAITQGAALDAYKQLPFKGMGTSADPGRTTREFGRDLIRGTNPGFGYDDTIEALRKAVGPTPNLPDAMNRAKSVRPEDQFMRRLSDFYSSRR